MVTRAERGPKRVPALIRQYIADLSLLSDLNWVSEKTDGFVAVTERLGKQGVQFYPQISEDLAVVQDDSLSVDHYIVRDAVLRLLGHGVNLKVFGIDDLNCDKQEIEFNRVADSGHTELLTILSLSDDGSKTEHLRDWISKNREISFLNDMEEAKRAKDTMAFVVEKRKLMSEGRFVHLLDDAGVVDLVVKFKLGKPDVEVFGGNMGARIVIEFDRVVWDGSKNKHHKCDVIQINSKRIEIRLVDQRTLAGFVERDLPYLEEPQPDKVEVRKRAGLAGWLGEIEEIRMPQPAKKTLLEGLYINNKMVGEDGTVGELFADAMANPTKDYWDNSEQLLERQGAFLRREAEERDAQRLSEERARERRESETKKEVDAIVKDQVRRIVEDLASQGGYNEGWSGNERVYPDNNGGYHIYRGNTHLRAYPDGFGGFHIRKA
ncbi:MAG: hypothetical protein WAV56_02065 [Microgenomates group bacterium]